MYQPVQDLQEPPSPRVLKRAGRLRERVRTLREVFGEDRLRGALERERTLAAITTGEVEGLYRLDAGLAETLVAEGFSSDAALRLNQDEFDQIAAHRRASGFVMDSIREGVPVTAAFIRELHELVVAGQSHYVVHDQFGQSRRPLPKGEYKSHSNSVTLPDGTQHEYAPVVDVPSEVTNLVQMLEARRDDPLTLAAFAHHRLTQIHPFADGNGRTSRLLATYYLVRGGLLAFVVEKADKPEYLAALRNADSGNLSSLTTFVLRRQAAALARLEALLTAPEPDLPFHEFSRTLALWAATRGTLAIDMDVERDGVRAVALAAQQRLLDTVSRALVPFGEGGFRTNVSASALDSGPEQWSHLVRQAGFVRAPGVRAMSIHIAIELNDEHIGLVLAVVALTNVWPPTLALLPSPTGPAMVAEADDLLDALTDSWAEAMVAPKLSELAARL